MERRRRHRLAVNIENGLAALQHRRSPEAMFSPARALLDQVKLVATVDVTVPGGVAEDFWRSLVSPLDADIRFVVKRSAHSVKLYTGGADMLLDFQGRLTGAKAGDKIGLIATISLNLTRFMAHHAHRALVEVRDLDPSLALTCNAETRSRLAAQVLDGNDNLLIDWRPVLDARRSDGSTVCFDEWLAVYVEHVKNWTERRFSAVSPSATACLRWKSVSHAETYWEFSHEQALAWAGDAACFLEHQKEGEIRNAPAHAGDEASTNKIRKNGNSRWLISRLTKDLDIVIYAKTFKRVRFEVRHKRRIKQTVSRSARRADLSIPSQLECVVHDASKRMIAYWGALNTAMPRQSPTAKIIEMIQELVSAGPNALGPELIAAIFAHRAIDPPVQGSPITSEQFQNAQQLSFMSRSRPGLHQAVRLVLKAEFRFLLDEARDRHRAEPNLQPVATDD